jgi:hypothetical protein
VCILGPRPVVKSPSTFYRELHAFHNWQAQSILVCFGRERRDRPSIWLADRVSRKRIAYCSQFTIWAAPRPNRARPYFLAERVGKGGSRLAARF